MEKPCFGAIEAGGTKFICAFGRGPGDLSEPVRIPTTNPGETLGAVISFFQTVTDAGASLDALGIASFGPAEINKKSLRWGSILSTPKPGWSYCDIVGRVSKTLELPIGFDTDVNGAALAEHRWGAAKGCDAVAYVTIGTGIGGGFVMRGVPLHGVSHPEVGHIIPRRHPRDRQFPGVCPFHKDCLEGLASGPAIEARWGASLSKLPLSHEAHEIIAWYVAQLVVAIQAFISPERIILGGGVMHSPDLLSRVDCVARDLSAEYFGSDASFDGLLSLPGLGDQAGLLGGICLAEAAWQQRS